MLLQIEAEIKMHFPVADFTMCEASWSGLTVDSNNQNVV